MKKKIFIIAGIIVILAAGFLIWKGMTPKKVQKVNLPVMPMVKVDRGNLQKVVYSKGNVYEISRKEVKPEVKSIVNKVYSKKGSKIKKGDILFTMDNKEALLNLEKEKLNLVMKQRDYDKITKSLNENIINSPIEGRIAKLNVKPGDKVEKETVVAEITNPDLMELVAGFSSDEVKDIKLGQKANVFIVKYLDTISGIVTKIDSHGKASAGGGIFYDVTVRFTNKGAVLPDDEATINITTESGIVINSKEASKIKLYESEKIKAKISGVVTNCNVSEGDYIYKDSKLMELDVADIRTSLQEMELSMKQLQLSLDSLNNQLVKYRVTAPMDGIISEVNVNEGEEPPLDKPSVVINGSDTLELRVKVDEMDIPFIKLGQEGIVQLNAYENRNFTGTVREINNTGKLEGTSVTYEVKLELLDKNKEIKVGMSGDVDIIVEKKVNALRLPSTAVNIIDNKMGSVMKKSGEATIPVNVTIGIESDEFVEIVSGLKEGEEVLASSSPFPGNMPNMQNMTVRAVG